MVMGRPEKSYDSDAITRQVQTGAVGLAVVTTATMVWQALTRETPIEISYLFGETVDVTLGPNTLWPLTFIALAFTAGALLMSFVPAFGRFPVVVTKENAERLYRASERLNAWISLGIQLTVAVSLIMLLLQERVSLVVVAIPALVTIVVWFRGFAKISRDEFIRREIQGGK